MGLLASGVSRRLQHCSAFSPRSPAPGAAAGPGRLLGDGPRLPSRFITWPSPLQHATPDPSSLLQEDNGTAGKWCIQAVAALQRLLPSITRSWGRSRTRSPTG